jgi:hypothetical protein
MSFLPIEPGVDNARRQITLSSRLAERDRSVSGLFRARVRGHPCAASNASDKTAADTKVQTHIDGALKTLGTTKAVLDVQLSRLGPHKCESFSKAAPTLAV